MRREKVFLNVPSFKRALYEAQKGRTVYVAIHNGELARCECTVKSGKAIIDFDLYTPSCIHDLTSDAQRALYREHRSYGKKCLPEAGYTGTIIAAFSGDVLHFEVLVQHAEIWFRKIVGVLRNRANLQEVDPDWIESWESIQSRLLATAQLDKTALN
jgi:hypothetical protein